MDIWQQLTQTITLLGILSLGIFAGLEYVLAKVAHSRELEQVHSRCNEFKRYVEELEEAEEQHREYDYAAAEMAWNQSMDAVDMLLRSLS